MKRKEYFDSVKFGQRVRALRREMGFNQDDLAEFLDVTRSAYSGMEIGKHVPSLNTFLGIYHFFNNKGVNLSTDYLFGIIDKYGKGLELELQRLKAECEKVSKEKDLIREQNDQLKEINKLLKDKLS